MKLCVSFKCVSGEFSVTCIVLPRYWHFWLSIRGNSLLVFQLLQWWKLGCRLDIWSSLGKKTVLQMVTESLRYVSQNYAQTKVYFCMIWPRMLLGFEWWLQLLTLHLLLRSNCMDTRVTFNMKYTHASLRIAYCSVSFTDQLSWHPASLLKSISWLCTRFILVEQGRKSTYVCLFQLSTLLWMSLWYCKMFKSIQMNLYP